MYNFNPADYPKTEDYQEELLKAVEKEIGKEELDKLAIELVLKGHPDWVSKSIRFRLDINDKLGVLKKLERRDQSISASGTKIKKDKIIQYYVEQIKALVEKKKSEI